MEAGAGSDALSHRPSRRPSDFWASQPEEKEKKTAE